MEEPNCPDFYGFLFSGNKFEKRVIMNSYDFWTVEEANEYASEELSEMIGDNEL